MLCGMARIILSFRLRMDFRLKPVFEVKIQKMIEENILKQNKAIIITIN